MFKVGAEIYEREGLEAYCRYQLEHENDVLKPGTGFALIEAMLRVNQIDTGVRRTEVVIISRNSADTSLRISNSIDNYNLDITRAAFTGGEPVAKYLNAFEVDLFLSATEEDVQAAVESNVAAGLYQQQGLEAFIEHEKINGEKPLPEGPFAKLLKTLSFLQFDLDSNSTQASPPIRTALVTARNSPAHERVIRTLRTWNVRIDETFFLGGVPKHKILQSFSPHIFFDDQHQHCEGAARVVPTARVPHRDDETKTA